MSVMLYLTDKSVVIEYDLMLVRYFTMQQYVDSLFCDYQNILCKLYIVIRGYR